jgi:hypothetical protein
MQNPLVLIGIILSAVIAGVSIGILVTLLFYRHRSKLFRTEHGIPDLIGQWQCQWFDDAQPANQPKVQDTIEVQKWATNGEFVARGRQPQFQLSYPIVGEVDASRVVTLVYRAARYPYEPNRGIVCLELSRDGKTMEGHWFGRRFSGQLGGGRVKCVRTFETAQAA